MPKDQKEHLLRVLEQIETKCYQLQIHKKENAHYQKQATLWGAALAQDCYPPLPMSIHTESGADDLIKMHRSGKLSACGHGGEIKIVFELRRRHAGSKTPEDDKEEIAEYFRRMGMISHDDTPRLGPYGNGHLGELPRLFVNSKGNISHGMIAPLSLRLFSQSTSQKRKTTAPLS